MPGNLAIAQVVEGKPENRQGPPLQAQENGEAQVGCRRGDLNPHALTGH